VYEGLWSEVGEIFNNPDFIVQQSTGFHDKNNKPIFKGDVLKFYTGTITDKNGTRDSYCNFIPELDEYKGSGEYDDEFVFGYILKHPSKDSEIIGNIYQHPHLLEDRQ